MLIRVSIFLLIAALGVAVCGDAASDAYKHGVRAERKGDYDGAYAFYKRAYTGTPGNPAYFIAFTRLRSATSNQHLRAGQLLRKAGSLTDALAEFQRAAQIDSSSFIAQQELKRTAEMIGQKERQEPAPKGILAPTLEEELAEPVALRPLSTAPITMHMTATADLAYKTIGRIAGINVIMDPDYRPPQITVDLTDVTLREAFDMVRLQSKTFWRPVLANTIFVTTDSQSKRKEMEENVMQTFYLQNITTPAELTEAANVVKQMLDITRVQLLQAQSALIVRGTPDQLLVAQKLLSEIDKPRPEVLVDITVMEISRARVRTLGANVPTTVSVNYVPGVGGSVSASPAPNSANLGRYSLTMSGASFTALASDSNAKVLQSPEIRILNDEKATLRIGDRVPVATGSYSTGVVGGGSVSPLVGTQFTYLDVGVNVDISPHIHSNREVTLKMSLEISTVTGSSNIGGISEPTIGQRRIEHEARLADGEVNLLGGILEDSETQSMGGLPWVSKVPILKYFFAQENKQHQENEIIFAITPHIVRGQQANDEKTHFIEIGTGNAIELRHKPPSPPASAGDDRTDPAKSQRKPAAQPGSPAAMAVPAGAGKPVTR